MEYLTEENLFIFASCFLCGFIFSMFLAKLFRGDW